MTQANGSVHQSKADLEKLIKEHGGSIFQSENSRKNIVVLADKGSILRFSFPCPEHILIIELVKVAALKKRGTHNILQTRWLLDSLDIGFLLPIEPR
jgi:DNA ligase 4